MPIAVAPPRHLTIAFALSGIAMAAGISAFEFTHPLNEGRLDLGRRRPAPAEIVNPAFTPTPPLLAQNTPPPPPPAPAPDSKNFTTPSGISVDLVTHTLTLKGRISIQSGLIELFACTEGGKDHESVVVVPCPPQELQLALILLGLKEGKEGPKGFGDPTKPTGDRVVCEIEWTKDGKTERHCAEDCVRNGREHAAMARVGWVYTGSEFQDEIDPDTGKPTGRTIYAANRQKTLIATYHDPTALLDNPLYDGGDDGLYFAEEKILPPPGTPVVISIRPATPEEVKTMTQLEAEADAKSPVRPEAVPPTPKDGK